MIWFLESNFMYFIKGAVFYGQIEANIAVGT